MRQWLIETIMGLRKEYQANQVQAIGLCVPALVEPGNKQVARCVSLPYLEGEWLTRELEQHVQLPVVLTADAPAATYAEWHAMEHSPARFAHLRLGTGIGLGVITGGRLRAIEPGRAAHARVLVVDDRAEAAQCVCGLRGCLEVLAGGRAIVRVARRLGYAGLPDLQRACDAEKAAAVNLVDTIAQSVARAVANIDRTYRPEVVVLGGGVIVHLPALFHGTVRACEALRVCASSAGARAENAPGLRIAQAQCADDAGVVGAAMLAVSSLGTGAH